MTSRTPFRSPDVRRAATLAADAARAAITIIGMLIVSCGVALASEGACCLGQGCVTLSPGSCELKGGEFFGVGTDCDPAGGTCATAEREGACCFADGCVDLRASDCEREEGEFLGDDLLYGIGLGASLLDGLVRFDLSHGLKGPAKQFRVDLYLDALL